MLLLPHIFNRSKATYAMGGFFVFCVLAAMGQDFWHTLINRSAFYLSESALFRLYWLLFLPAVFLMPVISNRAPRRFIYLLLPPIFSALHILFFSLLVWALSSAFLDHTYTFLSVVKHGFADDLLPGTVIYTLILLLPVALPYFQQQKLDIVKTAAPVMVQQGGKYIPVHVNEIYWIRTDHPYIAIKTKEARYLHAGTLSGISEKLSDNFVRIHRSTIVNIALVKSYRSRLNGDYDVTMCDGEVLRLSRNFRADFKQHFSGSSAQQV